MSIFVIADLHLSFKNPKPMDIFGDNWGNHAEKIREDWKKKVTENDVVVLPGDFSWEMHLEDTKKVFYSFYKEYTETGKVSYCGNENASKYSMVETARSFASLLDEELK